MKKGKKREKKAIRGVDMRPQARKALLLYRKASGKTAEEIAQALGWLPAMYTGVEAGIVAPSAGQQEDIRRLLRSAIAKSEPAEVHYQSPGTRIRSEAKGEPPELVECGYLPTGDKATYCSPSYVTCSKCRLTPAWIDAMRIYWAGLE